MFGERAGDAGATAAGRLRAIRQVRLLALGGRQAGVVRRLRRDVEPSLQIGDPSRQRLDRGVLRQDQGDQVILGES